MKSLDWQMLLFVGATMAKEFWLYYGLPRMYYFSTSQHNDKIDAA